MRHATTLVLLLALAAACGDDAPTRDTTVAPTDADDARDVDEADSAEGGDGAVETQDDTAEATGDDTADATPEDTEVAADTTTAPPTDTLTIDSGALEIEVVTTVVRPPAAGELRIGELMIDPIGRSDLVGEWLELVNLTDDATLDLADCWLSLDPASGAAGRTSLGGSGLARVGPGEALVVGRTRDLDDNGGVPVDVVQAGVLLPNAAGRVAVGCGEATLHTILWGAEWPLAPGRALVVPTDGAAAPDAACAARVAYGPETASGTNRGTPGVVDGACPARDGVVDACALALPEAGEVMIGSPVAARVWLDEAGETDLSDAVDTIPFLVVELGIGPADGTIVYAAATPAPEAFDPAAPTRDHYAATYTPGLGAWRVAGRVSLDAGASWTACGERMVVVSPSPCEPNPCTAEATTRCDGDVLERVSALGVCTLVGGDAACDHAPERVDCAALAGRCEEAAGVAACVDVAGPPARGEVVIAELMKNPNLVDDTVGEWIEFVNIGTRVVQLSRCELSDDGTDRVVMADSYGSLTIEPGEHLVVAASAAPGVNGGVQAAWGWAGHGTLELLNGADALVLTCAGEAIDTVRWDNAGFPNPTGRSMQLSAKYLDPARNDVGSSWCAAQSAIQPGATQPDYGTPGAPNAVCPELVQRCRLAAPATLSAVAGQTYTVGVQLRHAGLTDLGAGVDDDGFVRVEAGSGPTGWYPSWGGWTWFPGAPDGTWSDATSPLEDQWLVVLEADGDDDEVDVSGRVSIDGGLSWTYCDRDAATPTGDGSQDGYQIQNALRVTIAPSDPCLPNPCTAPPADACDALERLVRYPAVGECTPVVGGDAACAYPADVIDCAALGGTCDAELVRCDTLVPWPGAGELVVTEVMPWPGAVADFFGEWIELESVAAAPVNLVGCELADASAGLVIDVPGHALVVAPGERVVLARSADPADNGGVAAAFAWGDALGLGNAGDTVAITCAGVLVDAVVIDQAFPLARGVALQLDATRVDAGDNDAALAWCEASAPYGDGDLGTPGGPNDACTP